MPNINPNAERRAAITAMLKRSGPLTTSQIALQLDVYPKTAQATLQAMKADGLIQSEGKSPMIWDIPRQVSTGPKADMRHRQMDGVFRGVDWSVSTSRPGCMDHLQHPSRRGDELVMHQQRMIHMASPVSQFASINTKERAL